MEYQKLERLQLRGASAMRLNLGCGYHHPEGWVNADVDPGRGPETVLALDWEAREEPLPWEDATFDQVMLFHVINHVRLDYLDYFLQEVRRVTAPGGGVMVMTPDAQATMSDLTTTLFTGDGKEWTLESDTSLDDENGHPVFLPVLEDDETGGITTISRPIVWTPDVMRHLTQAHGLQTPNYWNCYADRNVNIIRRFFDNVWVISVNGLDPKMFPHGQHYKSCTDRSPSPNGWDDQGPGWDSRETIGRERSVYDQRPPDSQGEPCEQHDPGADLFVWTDPDTGFVWPIRGMGRRSCLVMATVTSS